MPRRPFVGRAKRGLAPHHAIDDLKADWRGDGVPEADQRRVIEEAETGLLVADQVARIGRLGEARPSGAAAVLLQRGDDRRQRVSGLRQRFGRRIGPNEQINKCT